MSENNRFVTIPREASEIKTVVFVCTGNTCRSPMAAGMFSVLLRQRGVADVEVRSCGTGAFPGMPPTENAVMAAAEYGADISQHRSRTLSQYVLAQGDLFVCMTEQHRALLLNYLPPELVCVLGSGISDPYGGDSAQYRACAAQIWDALQSLVKEF